jgi:hypothetical protein
MSKNNFQDVLARELAAFLAPLLSYSSGPEKRVELLGKLGLDEDVIVGRGGSSVGISQSINGLVQLYESLSVLSQSSIESFSDLAVLLESSGDLPALIQTLDAATSVSGSNGVLEKNGKALLDFLTHVYLQSRVPGILPILKILTIAEDVVLLPVFAGGQAVGEPDAYLRKPRSVVRFNWGRVLNVLRDPAGTLSNAYIVRNTSGDVDFDATADRLWPRIADGLRAIGAVVVHGTGDDQVDFGTWGTERARRTMTVFFPVDGDQIAERDGVGATLLLEQRFGLVVVPFGNFSFMETLGRWGIKLGGTLTPGLFAIRDGGIVHSTISPNVNFQLEATLLPGPRETQDEPDSVVVGSVSETGLELGGLKFVFHGAFSEGDIDWGVTAEIQKAQFKLAAGDGDGFLNALLGGSDSSASFSFSLGWSTTRGLSFGGAGGLRVLLPVQVGTTSFRVENIRLAIVVGDDAAESAAVSVQAGLTVASSIGPVAVALEGMGLKSDVGFPETGGGMGIGSLELGFLPPTGAGISINSGPVSGGGFLTFDADKGHYAGAINLRIYEIDVSALGVIDTKLPNGQRGFSMAILISARFSPIQLGLGFTLNGVGGFLGINRGVNVEYLKKAVREHSLDNVLFPENPKENALKILKSLSQAFPPDKDRYAFAPMAIIGWGGSVPILNAELGIIIEIPQPGRITVLGQIKAGLPKISDSAPVKLNLDAVGVLDFPGKSFSLDASLHHSKVGGFPVSGDMALRLKWSDPPNFALAIGGFHPRYLAPADFPALKRVTVNLTKNGGPRVTLEGYLAITSNTLQIGARAEIEAHKGSFNVYGYISFDALFQFQPFQMQADFRAGAAIRKGKRHISSVTLSGTLSGPNPWHAKGKACVSLLFFDICIGFDTDLSKRQVQASTSVPTLQVLVASMVTELQDLRNWVAELPANARRVVSLAAPVGTAALPVLLDPQGKMTVRQRLLPLDRQIELFNRLPMTKTTLSIASAALRDAGGVTTSLGKSRVEDYFAPAQFVKMTDADRLGRPGFERMSSGAAFSSADASGAEPIKRGLVKVKNVAYETTVVAVTNVVRPAVSGYQIAPTRSRALAGRSLSVLGGLVASGTERFVTSRRALQIATALSSGFTINNTKTGLERSDLVNPELAGRIGLSGTEADQVVRNHGEDSPDDSYNLQVTGRSSLVA